MRYSQGLQREPLDMSRLEERITELKGMRVRELRQELETLGLRTDGRVDRESLVELLEKDGRRALVGQEQSSEASSTGKLPKKVVDRMDELRAMKARDLRRELDSLGLRTEGYIDKESLLELLETQGLDAILHPRSAAKTHKPGPENSKEKAKEEKHVTATPKEGEAVCPIYLKRPHCEYGAPSPDARAITIDIEAPDNLRFVLDTATHHSAIKAEVAYSLNASDLGEPEWAKRNAPNVGIRLMSLGRCWFGDGKVDCGEVKVFSVPGAELPVPTGTAGILGVDFLSLFDWDFDFENKTVHIASKKDIKAPLPFDVSSLHAVPLRKIRTSMNAELYVCGVKVLGEGQGSDDASGGCHGQAIPDLAVSSTMCNELAVEGIPQPARPPPKERPAKSKRGTGFGSSQAKRSSSREPTSDNRSLRFCIGDWPEYTGVEAVASVGNTRAFQELGLSDWPTVILGPDVLCRERLVLSFRQNKMWLPRGQQFPSSPQGQQFQSSSSTGKSVIELDFDDPLPYD
eukprot:TRINITY_DN32736_c0_g1_i1.p1 TRINITY_DN32736_c0_g1~~TRINITY_DN32736_c0_g1_i1.p1  ORF type:complete len:603 (-),score=119.89 TRINITY_DN32736_c0_g1_i1:21-1568(-)